MSNIFDKYPMATKALREQDHLCRFLMMPGMPDDSLTIQRNAAEIIDADASGDDAHKDAMITTCILMLSPQYIFDTPHRFTKDYNQAVQTLVLEVLEGKEPPSKPLAEIMLALSIAPTALIVKELQNMSAADLAEKKPVFNESMKPCEGFKQAAQNQALSARLDQALKTINNAFTPPKINVKKPGKNDWNL
jgi:hypothetical protein